MVDLTWNVKEGESGSAWIVIVTKSGLGGGGGGKGYEMCQLSWLVRLALIT